MMARNTQFPFENVQKFVKISHFLVVLSRIFQITYFSKNCFVEIYQLTEMIEISIGGVGEFESAVADVVQGLVVDAEGLIGVLDELMDREGGVVGLDHCVGHLGRGHHRERRHDAVGVLFADLRDQQGAHS